MWIEEPRYSAMQQENKSLKTGAKFKSITKSQVVKSIGQLFGPPKKNQIFSRFNKFKLVQKTVELQEHVEMQEHVKPRKFQGLRSSVLNFNTKNSTEKGDLLNRLKQYLNRSKHPIKTDQINNLKITGKFFEKQ